MALRPFTLDDFIGQMSRVKDLGGARKAMTMIPGMSDLLKRLPAEEWDIEKQMKGFQAIYRSMTPAERQAPESVNHSRRQRIARGAGVTIHAVTSLLRQFDQAREMMRAAGIPRIHRFRPSPKLVLGLVTDNTVHRDPSYVDPGQPNRHALRRLILITAALIATIACARFLYPLLQ
jgi:hypothetical protein